jgi:hypothetical protein
MKSVSKWKRYRKIVTQEMRPYIPGEDLSEISLSREDAPSILEGGMIARNSENHKDQWYVAKAFFEKNYRPEDECNCPGAKFVRHIKQHLSDNEDVICTICGQTVSKIALGI